MTLTAVGGSLTAVGGSLIGLGSAGYAQGVFAPEGWGEEWRTYRDGGTSTDRREVVVFGDSTTFGSGGNYSWVQQVRNRAVAAGLTDGGKGIFAQGESDIGYEAPEINGFVSSTFTGVPDQWDALVGQYYYSGTGGQTLTLRFRSTAARIWYVDRDNAGGFSYSIDGGAPVVVDATRTTGQPLDKFVYIDGLATNTTHQIVLTNRGGRTVGGGGGGALPGPTIDTIDWSQTAATGTFTAGTYYYVATQMFGTTESLPSAVKSVANPGGGRQHEVKLLVDSAHTGARIYRSTSPTGPFEYVAGATDAGGNDVIRFYYDTGTAVSPGVVPAPGAGEDGPTLDTSKPSVYLAFAPVNEVGVAFQKQATSGATMAGFFHGPTGTDITTAHTATRYQAPLGLVPTTTADSPTSADGYTAGNTVDTSYPTDARVRPILAMLDLGFNDLNNQTDTNYAVFVEGIRKFAGACRAVGCDGIVTTGNLPANAKWPTYGAGIYNAMKNEAATQGLAFVDLWEPFGGALDYTGGAVNPHLTKPEYVQQANYLWDGLLAV